MTTALLWARSAISCGESPVRWLSAAILLVLALLFDQPLRALNWSDLGLVAITTVLGSVVGHLGPNWAARYVTSEVLGIMQLLNPVYSFLSAVIILGASAEPLQPIAVVGCAIIVLGIAVYMYLKNKENMRELDNFDLKEKGELEQGGTDQ